MNYVKRQSLKPKKRSGEYPRQVAAPPPQRSDFAPTKIKRKNDGDLDEQPPSKRVQPNKSQKSGEVQSDSININKDRIPKTPGAKKYSANDRLKKYRQHLSERKEDVIKVHSILKVSCAKCDSNDSTVPKSEDAATKSSNAAYDDCTASSSVSIQKRLLETKCFDKSQTPGLKAKSNDNCNSCFTHKTFKSYGPNNNLNFSPQKQLLVENPDVDMEWSPIEVNEVVSDIKKLRQEMQANKEHEIRNKNESYENVFVVVDTNVFISHLDTIKDLMNLNPYASKYPIITVPWMVIQELDYFKDGRSDSNTITHSARRAVKFLNEELTAKNQRLKGQTVQDALKQEIRSSNPDDGILFCCMQISEEAKPTVLLSNDVNLRNKALIHGISSHGTTNIVSEINNILLGNDGERNKGDESERNKGEQIISVLTKLCSHVIENEINLAYGTIAKNLISDPPWSLKQCLAYFKRFWSSVFSLIIPQKQFVKVLDDMIYFHTSHKDISSDEDIEHFTKLCLSMCVYFKNCLSKYRDQVQNCITDIQEIVS